MSKLAKLGKLVREEVCFLFSDRHGLILKNTNPRTLHNFKCDMVINEMEECAPTLLSILRECTGPLKANSDRKTTNSRI